MDLYCRNELDNNLIYSRPLIKLVISFGTNGINEGKHVAFDPKILHCNMHKCGEWLIHELYTSLCYQQSHKLPFTSYIAMIYKQYSNNKNEPQAKPKQHKMGMIFSYNMNFHFNNKEHLTITMMVVIVIWTFFVVWPNMSPH